MYQTTLPDGTKMYVHKEGLTGLKEVGACETNETEFIKSFIKPDMVCVDIGANVGYFTILMAKQAKEVHAFEPDSTNFQLLLDNIGLNNLEMDVAVYNYAVGEMEKNVILHKCLDNNGMHRVYPSKWCKGDTETVQMVTLDSMIDHADFIKMDTEGSELGALLGMKRILQKGCTVLMEFHTPSIREYGREPLEVYDYMIGLGYDIRFSDDRPLRTWNDLNHRATKHAGINVICTKKSF